jgi:hemolysin III
MMEQDYLEEESRPLLRGWLHALATIGSVVVTVLLLLQTVHDLPGFFSTLVFGLSMILLYAVSSIYNIGWWTGRSLALLRAFDHSNIFVFIAGSYTPICVHVVGGPLGVTFLALIWSLAAAGVGYTVLKRRRSRWTTTALYIGMGWISLLMLPSLIGRLPVAALLLFLLGGILYTIGGVIYALRRPNPSPRFFGFHEVFHVFVVAGSVLFLVAIWGWVLPSAQS